MTNLSLLNLASPMSANAPALTISYSLMWAVETTSYVLFGCSFFLLGAYPTVPMRGRQRVFQYLPFAVLALFYFGVGGWFLSFYIHYTYIVPSAGARPSPSPGLVIATPVVAALSIVLHVYLLLRRRTRYLRASAGNQ